jgi:hypothetical protein
MGSELGRAMLRDMLGAGIPGNAGQCSALTCQQIEAIRERAFARGETPPSTDMLMERVVAPIMYRILFTPTPPTTAEAHRLLDALLNGEERRQ